MLAEPDATGIRYLRGDATAPLGRGNKIIAHICNDLGGWGAGFVLALSRRWAAPEAEYRAWAASGEDFVLGKTRFVPVESRPDGRIWVANLIGQHGLAPDQRGNPPIRYAAVEEGLRRIAVFAKENEASLHMPRIGCGLAGGIWEKIAPLIEAAICAQGLEATVYDLPGR
ncbi:MAG: macro domain-containing protein [Desulfovibrionaceae bacterium]|nr:macro domain-containing protein [Desulfovibrionaceae bacterium]